MKTLTTWCGSKVEARRWPLVLKGWQRLARKLTKEIEALKTPAHPAPESVNIASIPSAPPAPTMQPFRVEIHSHGRAFERRVFALHQKEALLAVLENTPECDPIWNAPGWDHVQVFADQRPFVL